MLLLLRGVLVLILLMEGRRRGGEVERLRRLCLHAKLLLLLRLARSLRLLLGQRWPMLGKAWVGLLLPRQGLHLLRVSLHGWPHAHHVGRLLLLHLLLLHQLLAMHGLPLHLLLHCNLVLLLMLLLLEHHSLLRGHLSWSLGIHDLARLLLWPVGLLHLVRRLLLLLLFLWRHHGRNVLALRL